MDKIILIIRRIYYFIFSKLFMRKRILFISFNGKQYSDNPKAISQYMLQHYPKYKQLWLFLDCSGREQNLPTGIKYKKLTKFTLFHYVATSSVVVDNDGLAYAGWLGLMPKSKQQLFIQTWHGDRGFKKCFYEIDGFKAKRPFSLEYDGCFDYFITGSVMAEPLVYKMFNYKGKLLKSGCPRNDIMFTDTTSQYNKVRELLGISNNTRILLYAPTFRQNIPEDTERIDFDEVVKVLEEKTHDNWVVVFRSHHFHADAYNSKYIDGRNLFEDMVDILVAADMLITDYSSCAGDFALLKRPIILYVDDLQSYKDKDRGLHFELEESPFMYANNNAELIEHLHKLDALYVQKNCEDILNFYGSYDEGNACEKVSKIIDKILKNKKEKK